MFFTTPILEMILLAVSGFTYLVTILHINFFNYTMKLQQIVTLKTKTTIGSISSFHNVVLSGCEVVKNENYSASANYGDYISGGPKPEGSASLSLIAR